MSSNGNGTSKPLNGWAQHNGHANGVSKHGFRDVKQNLPIEALMVIVGAAARMDIIRVLIGSPTHVTGIAQAVFLTVNAVSRELGVLESFGLVKWSRQKNRRVYSLTERVRFIRRGPMLQVAISNGQGLWLLVHLDDSADPAQEVPPPNIFIDCRELSARPQNRAPKRTPEAADLEIEVHMKLPQLQRKKAKNADARHT